MKTRILNLLLPVLALTAAACGDSFEFGTPTHDLDEGTDLSAGTTQVLWKNKGAVYPTKRIHNFKIIKQKNIDYHSSCPPTIICYLL